MLFLAGNTQRDHTRRRTAPSGPLFQMDDSDQEELLPPGNLVKPQCVREG